jgi:hypothetical protein
MELSRMASCIEQDVATAIQKNSPDSRRDAIEQVRAGIAYGFITHQVAAVLIAQLPKVERIHMHSAEAEQQSDLPKAG